MQRKIFRVERMFADKHGRGDGRAIPARGPFKKSATNISTHAPSRAQSVNLASLGDLRRELETIYGAIDRNKQELTSLRAHSGDGPRVMRAAHALGTAIGDMEKATQQILHATENIDEKARVLQSSVKSGYERELAQDIQDQVVRIYEACNFQDLTGQHITKAMDTLKFVERHVGHMMEIWSGIERSQHSDTATVPLSHSLVNGPKLEGDTGHVSQTDVDAMFD